MRFIAVLALVAGIFLVNPDVEAAGPSCPYFISEAQDGPTQETPAMPVPTHKGFVICNHDDSGGFPEGESRQIRDALLKKNPPLSKKIASGMVTISGLRPGGVYVFHENGRPYKQEIGPGGGFIRPVSVGGRWVMTVPTEAITDNARIEVVMSGGCSNPTGGRVRTKAAGEWKPGVSELADRWLKEDWRRFVISTVGCR